MGTEGLLVGPLADLDIVFRRAVATVIEHGHPVKLGDSLSVGNGRLTHECLNMSVHVTDLRDRLIFNPVFRFNLGAAVGRLMWVLSGSNRVADIEYYDANAVRFSDDGRSVPGSCDGARLLSPRPGLNQLASIIELLRDDPTTRRAVAAVYHPEDAGRRSRDIPCIVAVAFLVRKDRLETSLILRSSNVVRVFPYDVFIYSMLAEVVAAELELEAGGLFFHAVSCHAYEEDTAVGEAIVGASERFRRGVMGPIPAGRAFNDIERLLEFEKTCRLMGSGNDPDLLYRQLDKLTASLPEYWHSFAAVLVLHRLIKTGSLDLGRQSDLRHCAWTLMSPEFRLLMLAREDALTSMRADRGRAVG
jgi:thymidylate synthase